MKRRQESSRPHPDVELAAQRIRSAHHLVGALLSCADGIPGIALQLSHGVYEARLSSKQAGIEIFGIEHNLGAGLALAILDGTRTIAMAWMSPDSAEIAAMLALRKVRLFLFRKQRIDRVITVDLDAPRIQTIEKARDLARNLGVMPALAYWRVFEPRLSMTHLLSRSDRAEEGCTVGWDAVVQDACDEIPALRAQALALETPSSEFAPPYDRVVEILRTAANPVAEIAHLVTTEIERDLGAGLLSGRSDLPPEDAFVPVHATMLALAMECPAATQNGRAITTIDWRYGGGSLVRLPLDIDEIDGRIGIEQFWRRIPTGGRSYWNLFIRDDDIPADPENLADGFQPVVLVDDITEATIAADALLDEASKSRRWTIPYRAVVELRFGPFVRAEVLDFGTLVVFVCRTSRWEYSPIYVYLDRGEVIHGLEEVVEDPAEQDRPDRFNATLRLLLASIIRDFLVVEDRSSVFARAEERPRRPRKDGVQNEPVVVYLPRVRYPSRPDVRRLESALPASRRRMHEVSAHLRRSSTMSPTQRALAEMHRWTIPDGFTFVRPHRRGDLDKDVTYRSRSALRALFEIEDAEQTVSQTINDDWFDFEARVRRLVCDRGLTLEHVELLGEGDGIAAFAIAESGEEKLWLVHAVRSARLGQSAVERLRTRLDRAPHGTRALLATTGVATPSARADAAKLAITLLEQV